VQDGRGRLGFTSLGVAVGGAADWCSAAAANALLDNPPDAALLELTLHGPVLRFGAPTACALSGADLSATLDGAPLPLDWSFYARGGSVVRFGERRGGARAYLAVAGGLAVPKVLGSRSTDLRAGFGGLAGRRLQVGDRMPYPVPPDPLAVSGRTLRDGRWLVSAGEAPIRILPGPHPQRFAPEALETLCATDWEVSQQADRMGCRLVGDARLRHVDGADIASIGLPSGAIQVPGDGRPIVLLCDHQPTGGYAALATVIEADLPLLAQRTSGDRVRFALTTPTAALSALASRRASVAAMPHDGDWDALRLAGFGGHLAADPPREPG
jgi:antagonist of KipI